MARTLAIDLFREMVTRPPDQVDLATAALLIALDEYPGMNVAVYLGRIELLAKRTASRLLCNAAERPLEAIEALNRQLFEIEGFCGNQEDYYDPRNSFLNDVIDRRTGIPITLSILYMEVGRRIGLRVEGVGLPGHFVVKCKQDGVEVFVDPFERGEILKAEGCQKKLIQLHGKEVKFNRSWLDAVDHGQILTRMLHNLKGIYWNQRNYAKVVGIIEKVLLINPSAATELRDRGIAHYQLSHLSSAIEDWSRYLELQSGAPDAAQVAKNLKIAAQKLASRN